VIHATSLQVDACALKDEVVVFSVNNSTYFIIIKIKTNCSRQRAIASKS
jgi:hypothetical protein